MGELVLKAAYIEVNSVNLSVRLKEISLKCDKNLEDATTMTDEWERALASGKKWQATPRFNQDFVASGANSVDATLYAAFAGDAVVPFKLRATQAAAGTANPEWRGNIHVTDYEPLSGSWGEMVKAPCTLQGDGPLERYTGA